MNDYITDLMSWTNEQFKATRYSEYESADIFLSLIAWLSLPRLATQATSPIVHIQGYDWESAFKKAKSWHADDAAMKSEFDHFVTIWIEKIPEDLRALQDIGPKQIEYIASSTWNEICRKWVYALEGKNFKENSLVALDILESNLASGPSGHFYTPREIASLMVHFINDQNVSRIYDPYCRGGNLLSEAIKALPKVNHVSGFTSTKLYWKLATIRSLIMSNDALIDIQTTGLLDYPRNDGKFDFIISNPPFGHLSSKVSSNTGKWSQLLEEASKSEILMVAHMLDRLTPTGKAAVILPNISLTGQGVAKIMRKELVNNNLLDAIITLPARIYANTVVSTAIVMIDQQRKSEEILMLDASNMFRKEGRRHLLNLDEILKLVNNFDRNGNKPNDGRIKLVARKEIESKDYDLQFSKYADEPPLIPTEIRPSQQILEECEKLEAALMQEKVVMQTLLAGKIKKV